MARPGRSNAEIVQVLTEQVRRLEGGRRAAAQGGVTSGWQILDRLLPERGFRRGSLVEWLSVASGSGAATLALTAAGEACREAGALVVIDRQRQFYPPAAALLGIDLENLIVVRPREQDHAWAVDQVLRSPSVAAVLCWPGQWDDHTFRRLQLAAESSGNLGMLLRPVAVRSQPSWADLRLFVEALPGNSRHVRSWRLRVELLRSRVGMSGTAVELEIDPAQTARERSEISEVKTPPSLPRRMTASHSTLSLNEIAPGKSKGPGYETSPLPVAASLAAAASARRSAGA